MALDCFINHIGLDYCLTDGAYTAPASGLYLNKLPGISIEGMQGISDSDQENFFNLWDDVQISAANQFYLDLRTEINKCHQLQANCDYDAMACLNIDVLTPAWQYALATWLLYYRLFTDRVNFWATLSRDVAQEMRDFYTDKYNEALRQAVLLMDTSACCMPCGGNPQTVVWLP